MDDPIVAPSAVKHGVVPEAMLHAYWHPIRVWDMGEGFVMVVGADRAAHLLEVGYVRGAEADVIVHAMSARAKFLR